MKKTINKFIHLTYKIKKRDLACHWKNNLPVVATPILVWLVEIACMKIIKPELNKNSMTVGFSHESYHVNVAFKNNQLAITSKLESIINNKLKFSVAVYCKDKKIFYGTHERIIVDKNNFIRKLHEMKGNKNE